MKECYSYIYTNPYRDDVPVLVISKPVKEHTHALIPPHPDEAGDRVKPVRSGQAQPMIDTRQIPQVEDVVKFGWSGR